MIKKNILFILLLITIFLLSTLITYYYFISINTNNPTTSSSVETSVLSSTSFSSIPSLDLENIFSSDKDSRIQQLPPEQTITLITTGDIIPARSVNYKMTIYNDFTHPFLKTADLLKQADLTLINLEAPLIKDCPLTNEGMIFCGNQRFVEGLKLADIDIANLANNHTFNWGAEGIIQTIDLLQKQGIQTCGYPLSQLTIQQVKNTKIGFLGWDFLADFNAKEILCAISKAKSKVDLLIVSSHWGAEYQSLPSPATQDLAHQMIEAGADLIVGNHPHWIQPIEIYQNKVIFYAHGNFIFDQEWSQQTKTGFAARTTFYQNKIIDIEIFPIFISDFNQPELLEDEKKEAILHHLKTISKQNQSD